MIYLDANVIIRYLEGTVAIREPVHRRLTSERLIATSQLSRLECRCQPLGQNNATLLKIYDGFFASADTRLIEIDQAVINMATEIRAVESIKTPDAIHLASAIISGASVFLTGDFKLVRCKRIAVEII